MRTTFKNTVLIFIITLIWTTTDAIKKSDDDVKKSDDDVKKSTDDAKKSTDDAKKSAGLTVTCASSCRSRQSELRGLLGGTITVHFHIDATRFIGLEVIFMYKLILQPRM